MEKNTPKLRFPGFSGEWQKIKLGKVSKLLSSSYQLQDAMICGAYPLYDANNKIGYVNSFISDRKFFTIIKDGSGVGRIKLLPKMSSFTNTLNGLEGINKVSSTLFLYYLVSMINFNKYIQNGGIPHLYYNDYKLHSIFLPSLPEQKKIGNFLSLIDNTIDKLKKKKVLLKKYKKGALQKIFSRKVRFKDDNENNYPQWQKKKLGEVANQYSGLAGKSAKDFGYGKRYITYKQVYDSPQINEKKYGYVNIKTNEKQNMVSYGDILFTISSETAEEVGFSSVYLVESQVYLNSFCFGISICKNIIYPIFSKYIFRSQPIRNAIIKLAQGSTRYNISKTKMLEIEIFLPSLPEQEKIGNFLSALDKKIDVISKQIEKTELYKKFLLQQMFI